MYWLCIGCYWLLLVVCDVSCCVLVCIHYYWCLGVFICVYWFRMDVVFVCVCLFLCVFSGCVWVGTGVVGLCLLLCVVCWCVFSLCVYALCVFIVFSCRLLLLLLVYMCVY